MIFKDKDLNVEVEICSFIPGLDKQKEIVPKPAKHYMPEWWKTDIPKQNKKDRYEAFNVGKCPSFPDYFSQGFVIPMWADTIVSFDPKTKNWFTDSGRNEFFRVDSHPTSQFVDHVKPSFMGIDGQNVFKLITPWRIITPPGWSLLQLPLFYNFNKEWSIMPGIVDTDIWHEVNQQLLYHGNGEQIFIEKGTPLVQYIPFKRSKSKITVRHQTEKDKIRFNKAEFNYQSSLGGFGFYRKMQRERDKDER
jgi:hypothetical protein